MSWFFHRAIAAKIVICFGCVIGVGLCAGSVTFRGLQLFATTQQWTTHTYRVLEKVDELDGSLAKQDGELRGYLLTRERGFLDKAVARSVEVQGLIAEIKSLTADNDAQQVRIAALTDAVEAWRRQMPTIPNGVDSSADGRQVRAAEMLFEPVLAGLQDIRAEERRLLALRSAAEAQAFADAFWANAAGPVLSLAIAVLLGWTLHRVIARPLGRLAVATRRIADGDVSVEVPASAARDEIGELCRAIEGFRQDTVEAKRLRKEQQDTRLRATRERSAFVAQMADRFEEVVGSVVKAVSSATTEMEGSAASLLELADWTVEEMKTVSGATKAATTSMQTIAGDTQSLLDSAADINARMMKSSRTAGDAVAEADRTTESMQGLSQSANRIGVIVALINDIARQTNLLALNATIEAARAGDAGRGFAVVATEVKALADQTASATEDIRRQIEDIQGSAAHSVAAIDQIGRTIRDMATTIDEISAASVAQGEATRDMVLGTTATARATAETSVQLDQVKEGAVTTGAAATKVLAAAKNLTQQTNVLSDEAQRFVASVRRG